MKHVFGEALVPIVGACAALYLAVMWYAGVDLRWTWFAFPLLFTAFLWRQGRTVLGLSCLAYVALYVHLVGFSQATGNRGFWAAFLPVACLLVQIFGLIYFWLIEHIKHGR